MKLMTKEIEKRFARIGRQESVPDPIVVCKFFNPVGAGTWLATEYDPTDRIFFGYVTGLAEDEWGSFSLEELSSVRLFGGLGIERDLYFEPKPISKVAPAAVDKKANPALMRFTGGEQG
jgi:hypothetical protein